MCVDVLGYLRFSVEFGIGCTIKTAKRLARVVICLIYNVVREGFSSTS